MQHMLQKRKAKFIKAVLVVAGIAFVFLWIKNLPYLQEKTFERMVSKYEQVEVVIHYGDTAWEIQKKLTPNEDLRIPLYLAEELNGKKMGELKPGDRVIFLKEKE